MPCCVKAATCSNLYDDGHYFGTAELPNTSSTIITKIEFFTVGQLMLGGDSLQQRIDAYIKGVSDEFLVLWLKGR